ncbi:MAG: methylmalonyl-CoA mutase family protein [bacterium]
MDSGKKKWREEMEEAFREMPPRLEKYTTVSGMEIPELCVPEDICELRYDRDLGYPGVYPFTRGVQPSMYRGRLWTMRQFSGFGTATDTNRRFKYLLSQGQTGLSVAFHMPTLMGRDSDSEYARGEVGRCGVAVDTLRDMEILFDGIPLDQVTTSMTINAPASVLLAMYIAVAEKQGVSRRKIGGTIQNDILKEYIAQKSWIYPPRESMRIIQDILVFCTREVPRWNTISISGYHIREAGSTAVQELAFTLADGIGYVQAGIEAGLKVDEFAPRLSYFFNGHVDFFEEIAKYRAARRMWARIMKERFGAADARSMKLRFHTQTAGCSLTAQQPMNNVVRTALQALSAVLGGTQSLHTNSMDETLALPTEEAVTVALRTQQIIAEETGVANTIDPLAGSYFVEHMTDTMEREALAYIQEIDRLGGIIPAIELGYPQKEIADAAFRYQMAIETGEKTLVGVNKYVMGEEPPIEVLKIPPEKEQEQIRRLKEVKASRSSRDAGRAMKSLEAAARSQDNLMPHILEAVKAYCSVGEICDALRDIFGTYEDPAYF